jgi:hypothetical protein
MYERSHFQNGLAVFFSFLLFLNAVQCVNVLGFNGNFQVEGRWIWVYASSFSSNPSVGSQQIHELFENFSKYNLNFILFLVKSSRVGSSTIVL